MMRLIVFLTLITIFINNSNLSPIPYSETSQAPHDLLMGRCHPDEAFLHGEDIVVNNDGKSQISAEIGIYIDGPVSITCVKILNRIPDGKGGYPSYVSGGVHYNYVIFNVTTDYGEGFHFYVQVNGYTLEDNETPQLF